MIDRSNHYTPYIWPMLAWFFLCVGLAWYGWHRRQAIKGAFQFGVLMAISALSTIGGVFGLAAADFPTKVFWYKFQFFWLGPLVVSGFCFVVEYAGLGRFLRRRSRLLMVLVLSLGSVVIFSNDSHHWLWRGFSFDGIVLPVPATGYWVFTLAGYSLALLTLPILIWLFIRSPAYRWPVAFILCGQLVVRAGFGLELIRPGLLAPLHFSDLTFAFATSMYAIALFGFRAFDPIRLARKTVIEQIHEGILVLDPAGRIIDLNPAAGKILGLRAGRSQACITEVLPAYEWINAGSDGSGLAETRVKLGTGERARSYALNTSELLDPNGQALGRLLLLHDVTEQEQAQAQLLEQQRLVATVKERERLARELHDSIGQVLGYVSLQAQAIQKRLHDGDQSAAEAQLARLARVAKDAHVDVRDSILSLKAGTDQDWSFPAVLRQHMDEFREIYGIDTTLSLPADFEEYSFDMSTEVQLLRVIQEALTNARKHGHAHCVRISFEFQDSQAKIVIADDGRGFNIRVPAETGKDHLGLAFMRERVEQVGGQIAIESSPGAGVRLMLHVPVRRGQRKREEETHARAPGR